MYIRYNYDITHILWNGLRAVDPVVSRAAFTRVVSEPIISTGGVVLTRGTRTLCMEWNMKRKTPTINKTKIKQSEKYNNGCQENEFDNEKQVDNDNDDDDDDDSVMVIMMMIQY